MPTGCCSARSARSSLRCSDGDWSAREERSAHHEAHTDEFQGEHLVVAERHPDHERDHRDEVRDERRPGRTDSADERAHEGERDAGADHTEHGHGHDWPELPARVADLPEPVRRRPDRCEGEHLGEHHEGHAERPDRPFADLRQADEHHADEADGDAEQLGAACGQAEQHRRSGHSRTVAASNRRILS